MGKKLVRPFVHAGQRGSILVQAIVMGLAATALIYAVAPRLSSLRKTVASNSEPIPVKSFLNSVVDYTKIAITEHWCLTNNWKQDQTNCNLGHERNTERMLLTSRFLSSYAAQTPAPSPADPSLDEITGTIDVAALMTASTEPTNATFHPLAFAAQSLARDAGLQNSRIAVSVSKVQHAALPSSGANEHYLKIRVQVEPGTFIPRFLLPNRPGIEAIVGLYPREVNTFALMVAGDFRLDQSTPTNNFDIAVPRRTADSGGQLTFNSPVYVNKSLVLPRRPSSTSADEQYTPVRFQSKVVMGQGPLKIAQASGSPEVFSPTNQGGMGNWYYNDLGLRFGGLAEGVVVEGSQDRGLATLFRTYSDADAEAQRLKFACINRAIFRGTEALIQDTSLAMKLSVTAATNDNPTGANPWVVREPGPSTGPVPSQTPVIKTTHYFDMGLTGGLDRDLIRTGQSSIGGNEFVEATNADSYASLIPVIDDTSLLQVAAAFGQPGRSQIFFNPNLTLDQTPQGWPTAVNSTNPSLWLASSALNAPWLPAVIGNNRVGLNVLSLQNMDSRMRSIHETRPFEQFLDPSCVLPGDPLCGSPSQESYLFPVREMKEYFSSSGTNLGGGGTTFLSHLPANGPTRFFYNPLVNTYYPNPPADLAGHNAAPPTWRVGLPQLKNTGPSSAPVVKVFIKLGSLGSGFTLDNTSFILPQAEAILSASLARGSELRVPINNIAYKKISDLNALSTSPATQALQNEYSGIQALGTAVVSNPSPLASHYNQMVVSRENTLNSLIGSNAAANLVANALLEYRYAKLVQRCSVLQVNQPSCGPDDASDPRFSTPLSCSETVPARVYNLLLPSQHYPFNNQPIHVFLGINIFGAQNTQVPACLPTAINARAAQVNAQIPNSNQQQIEFYRKLAEHGSEIVIRLKDYSIAANSNTVPSAPFSNPLGTPTPPPPEAPVNELLNVQKDRLKLEVTFVREAGIYATIHSLLRRNNDPGVPAIHIDIEPFDLNSGGTTGNSRDRRGTIARYGRLSFVVPGNPNPEDNFNIGAYRFEPFNNIPGSSWNPTDWRIHSNYATSFNQIYENRRIPLLGQTQYLSDSFDSTAWARACTNVNGSMTQAQNLAPWSTDFSSDARDSWFFAVPQTMLDDPQISWQGKPMVPPPPSTRASPRSNPISTVLTSNTNGNFQVTAIAGNCIVRSDARIVSGFFVCDRFVVEARTEPLTIVGTVLTGDLDIHESAISSGISWYSLSHPSAKQILSARPNLSLLLSPTNKPVLTKPGATPGQLAECSEALPYTHPVWTPRLDPTNLMALNSCSPAGLRFRADPFTWSSVDPDCGLVPGAANNSCKYRAVHHQIKEFSREGNI